MPAKNPKDNPPHRDSATAAVQPKTAAKKAPASARRKDAALLAIERISPVVDMGAIWEEIAKLYPIEFRISFIRPDDLLVCDFILDNLKLVEGGSKLRRKDPSRAATVVLELPPQSFGEQAFLDATGPEVASNPTGDDKFAETSPATDDKNVAVPNAESHGPLPFAGIRMAGRSRIAFAMPADEAELPYTAEALLDACRRWPMRLDVNAAPDADPRVRERIREIASFNKAWLMELAQSDVLSEATQRLMQALGEAKIARPLADAAQRVAQQAAQALRAGKTRGLATTLKRKLYAEVEVMAKDFPQLRAGKKREYALAALSLRTTQTFAASDVEKFEIAHIEYLPFLPIISPPHKPGPTVTALELPYRVILSPISPAHWWHATQPVVHDGQTELWHTRLTQSTDGVGVDKPTKVRAIWSPDYDSMTDTQIIDVVNNLKPFRMSLDALDRQMLVKLMADFYQQDPDGHPFVPRAARAQRLALSALGALLDVEGNWSTLPADVGLEQWRHLATLGRDSYVRVVYKGFLCPFGHSASLIKVTERKFEYMDATRKNRVAVLRQRFFIVVREPVKQFSGAGHQYKGRNFPFTSVEILTRATPSLRAPDQCALSDPQNKIYASTPHRACFWPMLSANENFLFQLAATDIGGERVTFAMPLLFVGVEANQNDVALQAIIQRYDAEAPAPRRTASLGNATVCYAPADPGAEGDPRLPTGDMTFDAAEVTGVAKSAPQFYPEVESAQVGIAAVQRLLQQPDAVVPVAYPEVYKTGGFGGSNAGQVFLKTLEAYGLDFGEQVKSDALGGLATPGMAIQGLSRIMGPVAAEPPIHPEDIEAALGKVINNSFDPADFFKGAKMLGGIDLAELLEVVASLTGADVPKLLSKQLPDKLEARFDWETKINKSDPLGLFVPNPDGAQTELEMHGVLSSPIGDPTASTLSADASLVHFKVNLFGFIIVWFDKLAFSAKVGSKPDVTVDMHPTDAIEFGGPLEFVNKLREAIPSNGFVNLPSVDITPSGIGSRFSINLPSLGVGIFSLENVSLGAGFALPFDAKPLELRFNFCERQSPFSLTVSFLGGGGFFLIAIGTAGVKEIEAALEFGAGASINLGVASGSVEIKAGVYFHWLTSSVELAGYVRLHGELSILGLISASLTFNLQLAYLKENGHSVVWGEATLTIEIEILFFSTDVSVKCRREFGGSDADPKFIDLIPDQATWTHYCQAFAVEA